MSLSAIIFYSILFIMFVGFMIKHTATYMKFKKQVYNTPNDQLNGQIVDIMKAEMSYTFTIWLFTLCLVFAMMVVYFYMPHALKGN